MMTMSAPLGVLGAVNYFKDEYEHARGSYYTEDEKVVGQWSGQLAARFGLKGAVSREDFERLCEGQDPTTGEQLVRHVKPHKRINRHGEEIETDGHRAGFDITFSAPKSVSLAAIVGGDERIREAHAEAVRLTLQELEKYAQARLGGNKPAETTGKLLFASFQHDAARPDKRDGYAAPDLHTHNFAFNLTQTSEGKIKPLQPLEIYRCQQYGTALYRAKLAEGLQRRGYEIRIDKETGAPEIAGISREYIETSSPRQRDIKEAQQALGAESTRGIAGRNRRTKVYNRDEMKARHQEIDRQFGGQAHAVVREARALAQEISALLWDERASQTKAKESVTFAVEKGSEREAVNDMRQLMTDALRRNLGQTTVEAISAEMEEREARGQLVGVLLDDETKRRVTTEKMLQREQENIEIVRAGKGTQQPIAESVPEQVTTERGVTLNESQRAAVEQIVTSRDQILGFQGKAGVGKTTTLTAIREAAERAGFDVQGFAPSTRATKELNDAGIESRTLQKCLRQKHDPEAPRQFYVLDESSLASTRQLNAFLHRVRPEDRVLLVGDVRQHEGVEAGRPFAQLQEHGLETVKLDEIVRQQGEQKRIVENFSAGRVKEAVEMMRGQGQIIEIADPQERLKAIADDYCARPEGTIVISPANKERVELNQLIHEQLQADGQISKKNYRTKILENRNELTGAERTFAGAYNQDDVIRYTSGSKKYGISAGEYTRVLSTNEKENTITVKLDKSQREVTYNPQRLQGVTVYREAERQFSEGDRVQFRAPYHPERIANGELGTLEKIEKGKLTVALDSGRRVSFEIEKNRHIDQGYAVTSHSSQGTTVDRVLINADTRESEKLLNQRMAYVAASRARTDARIYTDSDERLSEALARQVEKNTALEAAKRAPKPSVRHQLIEPEPQRAPESPARQGRQPDTPTVSERPAATTRPPAERAQRPVQAEPIQQVERLPTPAKPPARPYVTTMPVEVDKPALEMCRELIKLANDNHREATGRDISSLVQSFMQANLMKSAERPPAPEQLQGIAEASRALGLTEPPEMSNALQASLWRAYNDPNSEALLENFTQATETAFAQQTREAEPTLSPQPSIDDTLTID